MLTKILFAIMFGLGGWMMPYFYPSTDEPIIIVCYGYAVLTIGTSLGGYVVGNMLAEHLARFIPCRYKSKPGSRRSLRPLSDDGGCFIAEDGSGNLRYVEMDHCVVLFTKNEDIYNIVFDTITRPCFAVYLPKRINFFGLFADFSRLRPKIQFVLPRKEMIRKGNVITTVNNQIVSL